MAKFPVDAPKARVMRRFGQSDSSWCARLSTLPCGVSAPKDTDFLSMPNHSTIKASTLRTILTQAGIARKDFLRAYEQS